MRLTRCLVISLFVFGCSTPEVSRDAASDVRVADAVTDAGTAIDTGTAVDTATIADAGAPRDQGAPEATAVDVSGGDVPTDVPRDAASEAAVDVASADVPADTSADAGDPRLGRVVPDFMLPDLNPNSRTHRMTVAPSAQRGAISVWYFASAT